MKQKKIIKMLDPKETSRVQELRLIRKVLDSDINSMMVFADLGIRHIVDITQDMPPKNAKEFTNVIRKGLVGYHKALTPYLQHNRFKKHKFTQYSSYFIRKEITGKG